MPPAEESQIKNCMAQTSHLQICAFLLGFIGWIMCIASTANKEWRVWHLDNITNARPSIMWIGIWAVCFKNTPVAQDEDMDIMHCQDFSETHVFLPREIFVAQDLMSLAIIVEAVAMSFILFAFWIRFYRADQQHKLITHLFCIGGVMNLASGMIVFIPVSWNMVSIWMKEKIFFPVVFELPSSPRHQNAGVGIHLGFASAGSQMLSGALMLYDTCLLAFSKVLPLETESVETCESESQTENLPRNSSFLEFNVTESHKSVSDISNIEASPKDGTEQFRIPTGSVPGGPTVAPRLIIVTPYAT